MRSLFLCLLALLVAGALAWHLPELRWAAVLVPCGLLMVGLLWLEGSKSDFPEPR